MLDPDGARRPIGRRRGANPRATWNRLQGVGGALILGTAVACGATRGLAPRVIPPSASSEWYAANGPLLAEYLKTLPASSIGQPLKGIRLAGDPEESRWLEGQTYLGVPTGLPAGVGVRLVDDGNRVLAYLWLDAGAEPYGLEPCSSGEQKGIRARRAGGGPHAWKALEAEHGVVYTACPPEAWIPASAPSRRPSPPPPGLG